MTEFSCYFTVNCDDNEACHEENDVEDICCCLVFSATHNGIYFTIVSMCNTSFKIYWM